MMHHTVRYLPALSPPNEVERNTCLAKLYATWPKAQTCAATKIVAEARTEFSATGVCFSLIDSTHELIKAESGFVTTSGNIPRAASMAAHVLLTSDVLVVLDARKVCISIPYAACLLTICRTGDSESTQLSSMRHTFVSLLVHHS